MKDQSDDPSHHKWMLLPRSYISLLITVGNNRTRELKTASNHSLSKTNFLPFRITLPQHWQCKCHQQCVWLHSALFLVFLKNELPWLRYIFNKQTSTQVQAIWHASCTVTNVLGKYMSKQHISGLTPTKQHISGLYMKKQYVSGLYTNTLVVCTWINNTYVVCTQTTVCTWITTQKWFLHE